MQTGVDRSGPLVVEMGCKRIFETVYLQVNGRKTRHGSLPTGRVCRCLALPERRNGLLPLDKDHSSIIAREGLPIIGIAVAAFLIALWADWMKLAGLLLLLSLFIVWFFRNPERHVPEDPRLVLSPADGKVIRIEEVADADFDGDIVRKISIFMNIFDVHVNRVPCSGRILSTVYRKGQFLSANLDKASEANERHTILIETHEGRRIKTIQIAGLIARRIVWWVQEGMAVTRGERFGMIRFGSRLEVYLPLEAKVTIREGERVTAGETPIGEMS